MLWMKIINAILKYRPVTHASARLSLKSPKLAYQYNATFYAEANYYQTVKNK